MAHLRKLPTYFVRGDERRAAYYTVTARELLAEGFVEESEVAEAAVLHDPTPEQPVEVGADAFEDLVHDELVTELDKMTRVELLDWAAAQGHDLKNSLAKADLLEACKQIEASL